MMKFRPLFSLIGALALAGCMGSAEKTAQTARYTIEGDVSAIYSSGEFVLWVAEKKTGEGAAAGMSTARMSASSAADEDSTDPFRDGLNIISEAAIVDGRFFLEGEAPAPRNVFFYVLNSISTDGIRMAPVRGQSFVLEPGDLKLMMDDRARFTVEGGHYNDIVVNSWRLSPEYLQVMADYRRTVPAVDGETKAQRRAREDKSAELFDELLRLEGRGRREVALNHEDPLARKLTLESAWIRGPWYGDAVRQLAEIIPHDPWLISSLAWEEEYSARQAKAAAFAVGAQISDFEAETLAGETVSIAGARHGKAVVLVEFWASWCGPCRAEIPHMKQAYADYGPLGFEIFSFTVDDEREDWREASEEEALPWINAGMGIDHPATEAYGVTGVPANFLVDAPSGEIIATNLRGHKLDEALAERFRKTDARSGDRTGPGSTRNRG